MRWCNYKNCSGDGTSRTEQFTFLRNKEETLKLKEKELLKKDKLLQKKALKLQKHSDKKAKADSKAAEKLRKARKNLIIALSSKRKTEKDNKNRSRKRFKSTNNKRNKSKGKGKKSKVDLHSCLYNILSRLYRPCGYGCATCPRVPCIEQNRTDSCLRKLIDRQCHFLDPCARFQPCRCEIPARRYSRNPAGDCFLMTLRRTPQVWMYHRWPKIYPQYLSAYRAQWRSLGHCLLFAAAIVFWTPLLLCLALCKCLCCSCCTDCC